MIENTGPGVEVAAAKIVRSLNRFVAWSLSPEWERSALYWQAALLLLVVGVVCVAGPAGAFVLAAFVFAIAAWFLAPPVVIAAVFLFYLSFTHQFRSFVIFPIAGVEWHPRELLLFALGAYCLVQVFCFPSRLPSDSMSGWVVLVGSYSVLIAAVGVFWQRDTHRIVSELRIPIFLFTYPALLLLVRPDHLRLFRRAFGLCTLVLATIAIAFFAYTLFTGRIGSTQNVLGEFVQHIALNTLVQSVRPAGHMFYEVCLAVFVSLLFCPNISKSRRLLYGACIAVLLAAVAVTIMRTAYASVAVSLLLLLFLSIPSGRTQLGVAALCALTALAGLALWLTPLQQAFVSLIPAMGVSIQARFVEMEGAYRAFWEHPLLGTGMGSTFEALGLAAKTSQIAYSQSTFQTIHNVWMYFLFKGGLLGFLLILTGLAGIFIEMARRIPHVRDAHERAIFRGLTAAYGAQLVAMLAMPRLLYPSGYVLVAMFAAYTVLLTAGQRETLLAQSPEARSPVA